MLWALFVTCLILGAAYWFTRYVVGRMAGGGLVRGRRISVLEQVPVGKDQRILLVEIGGRLYLFGAAPGGITNLGELPPEALDAGEEPPQSGNPPDSFAQALRRVLEQRKR